MSEYLVLWDNPTGKVTNSDLDLAGSMIHHTCMSDFYHIREITELTWTDNTVDLWWKWKGSATSTSQPVHILQLQDIHQQFHLYISCQDFVSGVEKIIYDCLYQSQDLTRTALISYMDLTYPQRFPWKLWTLPSALIYTIVSALWWTT